MENGTLYGMDQLQSSRMLILDEHGDFRNDSHYPTYDYRDNVSMAISTMPPNMTFTRNSLIIVIVYGFCFIIASVGNLTVFLTLSRGRYRKSRISLMICHLSIADLLVAFFTIPIEIGWRLTVQWIAGNVACKVFLFLRAFGLYLSNFILICVSMDRYYAVLHPLRVNDARRRGKLMLSLAWLVSIACAIPQSFIFHVSKHPDHTNFTQCVTFGHFTSDIDEKIYNAFCIIMMYFVPLGVICWLYLRILCEINSKSRDNKPVVSKSNSNGTLNSSGSNQGSRLRLRRSDMSSIERARSRTLKMTIKIVVAFIFCWTPYVMINLWYIIDKRSAEGLNEMVQESLFLMAVGNSCANPLVYGSYAINLRKECCRFFVPCCCCYCNCCCGEAATKTNADVNPIQRSLGSKFQARETRSPGVSKRIAHSVRQAVQGLLKVGSCQTKSTAACAKPLMMPVSPRIRSVSATSKGAVSVEKLPLHVITPVVKENVLNLPCNETAEEKLEQTTPLNPPSELPAIMESEAV